MARAPSLLPPAASQEDPQGNMTQLYALRRLQKMKTQPAQVPGRVTPPPKPPILKKV